MSARAASCPSCGGEVLFKAGSSLVTVCPHCRSAVARKGVNLEAIGKVAELVPTSSPFKLGMSGKPKKAGLRPFTFIGRLQLSTGQGTWDEWHIVFEDGRYGWLAEAQGEFYVMRPLPPPSNPPAPEFSQIQPGMKLNFSPYGTFTVTDRRQALYASAEGDLPFTAPPGAVFMYADLSGADGSLATLDYGDDPGVDAFFVGGKVELENLGIDGLTKWADRKTKARAASLNCPSCGGALELKDPANTVRIACTYCGSLLGTGEGTSASGKFEILERLQQVPFKPDVPLGSKGTLLTRPYVVLGSMKKSCEVEGDTYFWTEYLLKETESEAYHWLVESNGHWSVVGGIPAGKVEESGRYAVYNGKTYKHFQKTQARVEAVLGEFYWEVARGETTWASDYVAPPRILSQETTEQEITWSEGTYLEPSQISEGFGIKETLPPPQGVGSNQPWPKAEAARAVMKMAGILAAVLLGLFILFNIWAPRLVVFDKEFDLAALMAPATPLDPSKAADEKVVLTEPFNIPRSGNIEVRIQAPTDNTWVGVDASLIEEQTGEIRAFYLLSDYYHGYSGGESWSEGSRARSVFLSQVPKGRYVLRLEPESDPGKAPANFRVRLRAGVPRVSRFVVILVLLCVGPVYYGFSKMAFEGRRWSESDYASS